jgi:hypothetical protein
MQEEIDNLRPLLRLSIRSADFRNTLQSMLRVAKMITEAHGHTRSTKEEDLDELFNREELFDVVSRFL